ncbi:MAG: FkbM family methyltransferase, partial [Primorskyibacter sp.]
MPLTCRGLRFPKDPNILTGRAKRLLRNGTYEYKEAAALLKVLKRGDIVLELGGGLGFMSSLAARHGASHVTIIEANPRLLDYIAQVHAANDITGVTRHHGLASTQDGPDKSFYVRRNFLASSLDPRSDSGVIEATISVPQIGLSG